MKKASRSLPGVRRIYSVLCRDLAPGSMLSAIAGAAPIAMFRDDLTEIPFSGQPTFRREAKHVNGARAYTSTLEFRSSVVLLDYVPMAFVVEQVNGSVWLIGAREPNYPVMEFVEDAGAPAGEPAVRTYTVTHTDILSGIPVIL